MKDDMNFTVYEDDDIAMKIIDNTVYLVSNDIGEKLAYSYCIL